MGTTWGERGGTDVPTQVRGWRGRCRPPRCAGAALLGLQVTTDSRLYLYLPGSRPRSHLDPESRGSTHLSARLETRTLQPDAPDLHHAERSDLARAADGWACFLKARVGMGRRGVEDPSRCRARSEGSR